MTLFFQLILNGIVNASLFALLAVGFGLVYRSLRVFHIAYGAVYVIAPYVIVALANSADFPLIPSVFLGVLVAAIVSILMDRAVYLPLERAGATTAVLFVASLGIYIVVVNIVAPIFGNEVKTISRGLEPTIGFAGLVLTRIQILQFFSGAIFALIFWLIIRNNTLMKGMWAMGETPDLVMVLGFPYEFMRGALFVLSSIFASLASMLIAFDVGIDPHVGMHALLTGAVAVLIGGVEVYWGWIGGALILAMLQSIITWQFSARWNDLVTFGILIFILLFRPQGLFSPRKRREER